MTDAISIPVERVCPRCGRGDVVPIVMGLPSAELFELAERGLVELGDCMVGPEDPDCVCRSCGHEWDSEQDQDE